MNGYLESVYKYSPTFVQDIICSVYGVKLYRERYGKPWKSYFEQLIESQFMSQEEIYELQDSLFKKMLKHALEHVPFYRETLKIKKKEIDKISYKQILSELPVVEKPTLREFLDDFISEFYPKESLIKLHTSGTTGTPLTIYIEPNARKLNYAFHERFKKWVGVNLFEKSITLAGRTIVPVTQNKSPFWRRNLVFHNTLFSSYHLGEGTLKYYIDKIRAIKPVFIDSYPSSIAVIADYMIKNDINDIRPKAIITSAETLLDNQREKIEIAFHCRVFDQYGCTEQVVFACQCERGSYHVNPEYGLLEVLDKNNRPVKNGELGEFVCTGFINTAMPLIRYKIGDMGIISDNKCDCGRYFTVIDKIYGRNDDILITQDGKYVGRLDPVFKGVESTIKEAQIIQEKLDLVTILIAKTPEYKDSDGEQIIRELRKRLGKEVSYQINFVDSIPRTSSGKFRAVICKVKE